MKARKNPPIISPVMGLALVIIIASGVYVVVHHNDIKSSITVSSSPATSPKSAFADRTWNNRYNVQSPVFLTTTGAPYAYHVVTASDNSQAIYRYSFVDSSDVEIPATRAGSGQILSLPVYAPTTSYLAYTQADRDPNDNTLTKNGTFKVRVLDTATKRIMIDIPAETPGKLNEQNRIEPLSWSPSGDILLIGKLGVINGLEQFDTKTGKESAIGNPKESLQPEMGREYWLDDTNFEQVYSTSTSVIGQGPADLMQTTYKVNTDVGVRWALDDPISDVTYNDPQIFGHYMVYYPHEADSNLGYANYLEIRDLSNPKAAPVKINTKGDTSNLALLSFDVSGRPQTVFYSSYDDHYDNGNIMRASFASTLYAYDIAAGTSKALANSPSLVNLYGWVDASHLLYSVYPDSRHDSATQYSVLNVSDGTSVRVKHLDTAQ